MSSESVSLLYQYAKVVRLHNWTIELLEQILDERIAAVSRKRCVTVHLISIVEKAVS